MNLPKYCLDTHPLVWYFTGQKTLSPKARKILDELFSGKITCYISIIVLLEIFHLSLKFKKFNFPKFLETIRLPNIIIVPLDRVILETCFALSKNLEIHDRIIAATASINECILVTKEKVLHDLTSLKVIWKT